MSVITTSPGCVARISDHGVIGLFFKVVLTRIFKLLIESGFFGQYVKIDHKSGKSCLEAFHQNEFFVRCFALINVVHDAINLVASAIRSRRRSVFSSRNRS